VPIQQPSGGDRLYRFLFDGLDLRGEALRLDAGWRAVLARNDYPSPVASQLGQGLAAAVLLSATLKFEGSLILQVQGDGPIPTLIAQATHDRSYRGIVRRRDDIASDPAAPFGNGSLILTIAPKEGQRVQGVVALRPAGLASALEEYFARSEQLPTRLWLAADGERAGGLLLQELPGQGERGDHWNRLVTLADTLTPRELLDLPPPTLLHRLFHQESLRLFDPEPVAFRCSCSRERIAATLQALGREEVEGILKEQGLVEVACDFCGHRYAFDARDLAGMFADG
jgi:molecular chaperone Hsp33